MDNPLGQHHAHPARRLNANGVKPSRYKKVKQFRGFAQLVAVIGGKAFWPI